MMFFCPTSACGLFMPRYTSGELITILYLLEVFNLDICLLSFVNYQCKISGSPRCACCIPRMVLDQRACVRKFGAFGCLFIVYAFILL
jgi:hypothetical protein